MIGCVIGGNGICLITSDSEYNGEEVDDFIEAMKDEYRIQLAGENNLPCTGISIYFNTN